MSLMRPWASRMAQRFVPMRLQYVVRRAFSAMCAFRHLGPSGLRPGGQSIAGSAVPVWLMRGDDGSECEAL